MSLPHTNKNVIYVDFKRQEWTEREPSWIGDSKPTSEDEARLDIARRAADILINNDDLTFAEAVKRVQDSDEVTPS